MSAIKKLIEQLKKAIENSPSGVSFVSFNYKDKEGEITKRLVNIGVSYQNALKKDMIFLSTLRFEDELNEQARVELLKSVILSIEKEENNDEITKGAIEEVKTINSLVFTEKEKESHSKKSEAQSEAYIPVTTGLKFHPVTEKLYIQGMSVKSTIIEEGETKADTRKPLTKAKDSIRKEMKSTKYRVFIIDNLESNFNVNGTTLELN